MENKILAIKGHSTRGNEVIEILEMLGGKNIGGLIGNTSGFYFIDCNNNINIENQLRTNFITFYLEEFLEKYPFKVGDKVTYKNLLAFDHIYIIKKMVWENNQIKYIIHNPCCDKYSYTVIIAPAEDLQLHEDEIYIDCPVNNNFNNDSKPGVTVNGEKLIPPKGYIIKTATMDGDNLTVEYVKNKPQYPKTYKECCEILDCKADYFLTDFSYKHRDVDISDYEDKIDDLLQNFRKLIYCRDAYWKIVGKEMGLSEPWKPDWNNDNQFKYIITCRRNNIIKDTYTAKDCILAFPTKEMRDAFFENFKDVIEKCKEFL